MGGRTDMSALAVGFWACAALVFYAYAGYPLLLAAWSRLRPWPSRRRGAPPASVSVVIAAYNEEGAIVRRLEEMIWQVASCGVPGEVIVVSDGSTDRTAERARSVGGPVRLIERGTNRGKAAALNAGCAAATGEVIAFADARQAWAPDALRRLLDAFADPEVGAVGGDLVLETYPGADFYWRYEKWIRRLESRIHSTVGVTGAICAVRHALYRPIPEGTVLDDVYWPLRVVLDGKRVLHEGEARAFDRLPGRRRDEFRRKVRTLSGNLQLVLRLPQALSPRRNPVWWQFVSHKLLRLLAPWALIAMAVLSGLLPRAPYRALFWAQAAFYLIALAGTWPPLSRRLAMVSAAASFLTLNAAAWVAFWVWITGRASRSWGKAAYDHTGVPGAG